jgi:hypothetical protein
MIFLVMKIQVVVFWVLTPFSVAIGYRRFGGPSCLHVHTVQYE